MKILYFEGAGMDFLPNDKEGDVCNYRIRTCFRNKNKHNIYLECSNDYKERLHVSHFFDTTKSTDENESGLPFDRALTQTYKYTKQDIKDWVNKQCDMDFDTIEVLDFFEMYKVHGDYTNYTEKYYNIMDDHVIDNRRTKARRVAYDRLDSAFKALCRNQYSTIGLYGCADDVLTVRCHGSEKEIGDNERIRTVNIWEYSGMDKNAKQEDPAARYRVYGIELNGDIYIEDRKFGTIIMIKNRDKTKEKAILEEYGLVQS